MQLTSAEIDQFNRDGFVVRPSLFNPAEIADLLRVVPQIASEAGPALVREEDGITLRTVHGPHLLDEYWRDLARDGRIVLPSQQLLNEQVYVYQSKVNFKSAKRGDRWEWHQDFVFWNQEDGLPRPDVLTVAVFLNDIDQHNGPLQMIPGSHRGGIIVDRESAQKEGGDDARPWLANTTAKLRYSLSEHTIKEARSERDPISLLGSAGTTVFFNSQVMHASSANTSDRDRRMALMTYCAVSNVPVPPNERRPEFLCPVDLQPITPLSARAMTAAAR